LTTTAIRHIRKVDKKLARLIDRVGPFALKPEKIKDPYRCLMQTIIYQQLNGKAAATIMERFENLTPKKPYPMPDDILRLGIKGMRPAGVSRQKASYLMDLAEHAKRGDLPSVRALNNMDDQAVVDALTVVKGIGVWTVEMYLMFRLGRMDVLPVLDYGVRKGWAKVYGKDPDVLPTPKELLAFGEVWRPYRTIPSWYLWRALELK
jgi:DNA-3-methyladenine glycosylase II